MHKLEVYQDYEQGKAAIGVRIMDSRATLADLLAVWQPLCDDSAVHKMYANDYHCACKGCQINCCLTAYVIPDLVALRRMSKHLGMEERELIQNCLDPDKRTLGFLRLRPNPCIFLQDNICTIYPERSLLCRFYICSTILGSTEQLIYSIAWVGVAAAQIYARQQGLLDKPPAGGFTSLDLMLARTIEEFSQHPGLPYFMLAEDYADIPLEPFLGDL